MIGQHFLKNIGRFSEQEIEYFDRKCETKFFQKGETLLVKGNICDKVYFLRDGLAYQYFENDIYETIVDLWVENDWILNANSFISRSPSNYTIKSFTEIEVVELSIYAIHELIAISPAFLQLGKILENDPNKVRMTESLLSPKQKYNQLIIDKPKVIQSYPLKMIASYLKISPETLSRVRAQF